MSNSPVYKRLKLDPDSPSPSVEGRLGNPFNAEEKVTLSREDVTGVSVTSMDAEDDEDHCVICLQHIRDRTVLPCAHDRMCFECILVWTAQSRRCPLCNAPIGPFLIHNMRSKYDYQKRYLPPLRTSPPPIVTPLPLSRGGNSTRNRGRSGTARWGNQSRRRSASQEYQDVQDELELAVDRRKWVYRHRLYAKHVASNPYTRYRPAPTPAQIAASPDLISRATIFVRRELRVWVNLDVEFLTTFILSLMKSLDLRSEPAVKLLAEFLDMDTPYHMGAISESTGRFLNAEQFAHELYSYLRSPFRDLVTYDSAVQYDIPDNTAPAPSQPSDEIRRWGPRSPTREEVSTRRRHRSSPSPLSHSPRDGYPHPSSPQYTDAEESLIRPSPRPPSEHETVSRNSKGKGKERAYLRPDKNIPYRDDGHDHFQSHSKSSRTSPQPGRHHVRTSRGRQSRRRSPLGQSNPLRRGEMDTFGDDRGPAKATSSPEFTPRINSPERDSQGPLAHTDDSNSPNYRDPVPLKSETTWGISIKGQAKLLKHSQTSSEGRDSQLSPPDSSKDRSPRHGASILDVRHRNFSRASATRETLPNNASTINPHAGCVIHKSQIDPDNAEPENQATKAATHAVRSEAEAAGAYLETGHIDHVPPSSPSHSLPAGHRSAPEIMARTRAKIARLRGRQSVAGVTSATDPEEGTSEGTRASFSQREQLLDRLEEEKRQALTQPADGAPTYRSACDDSKHDASTNFEVSTSKSTDQADANTGVSADSQQAENRLRAQARMRVRLAAEKRRLEEQQTTSREDVLRTKLLSRRV